MIAKSEFLGAWDALPGERIVYYDGWACLCSDRYLKDRAYLNWLTESDYRHCVFYFYAVGEGI